MFHRDVTVLPVWQPLSEHGSDLRVEVYKRSLPQMALFFPVDCGKSHGGRRTTPISEQLTYLLTCKHLSLNTLLWEVSIRGVAVTLGLPMA